MKRSSYIAFLVIIIFLFVAVTAYIVSKSVVRQTENTFQQKEQQTKGLNEKVFPSASLK